MNEMGTAPLPSPLVPVVPKRNQQTPVALFRFMWPAVPSCAFLCLHRPETEAPSGRTAVSRTKQDGNGNETSKRRDGNGNGERLEAGTEREMCRPFPFPHLSRSPLFRSFPVCLRATIKTIFPPLRYCTPTFRKKVKKYL